MPASVVLAGIIYGIVSYQFAANNTGLFSLYLFFDIIFKFCFLNSNIYHLLQTTIEVLLIWTWAGTFRGFLLRFWADNSIILVLNFFFFYLKIDQSNLSRQLLVLLKINWIGDDNLLFSFAERRCVFFWEAALSDEAIIHQAVLLPDDRRRMLGHQKTVHRQLAFHLSDAGPNSLDQWLWSHIIFCLVLAANAAHLF